MTSSQRRAAALVPLLLAPLLLAACSTTAPSSTSGGAVASAHAQASAIASAEGKAASAVSGPITTGDRLCALVPGSQAAAATQTTPTITDVVSSSGPDDEPTCGYQSADQKIALIVLWGPAKDDPYHPPMPTMGSGATTAVSGLGHPAAANTVEVDVQIGDHTLVVESFGPKDATRDQVIALAKLVAPKL